MTCHNMTQFRFDVEINVVISTHSGLTNEVILTSFRRGDPVSVASRSTV